MRRICMKILVVFLTVCLVGNSGCRILENTVSDIDGWDLSACVDGFGICWDLYWDNADKFTEGFEEAMGAL